MKTQTILALLLAGVVVAAQQTRPEFVRLSDADATRIAREVRQSVAARMPEGLELSLWASSELLADPIALDIDVDGTVYVTSTPRSIIPLDIRQHPDWVPDVHTLKTVEDLRQFFRRVMAPERSAENTWLPDYNGDGSRDYRDLASYKERIYRLQDLSGDGIADVSLIAYEGFNDDVASDIAGGVMRVEDGLLVAAAPDLWKLRDTNGDGKFDVKESLSHGYSVHPAFSGHDLSGITQGPDGRIYWKVGDIGMNVVDQTGRRWAYPNQGAIMRANPDGSDFEVFAAGLRNTQEFAFDQHGNIVSVDNDGDHPGETERLVYVTYGSDAGWRSNWQYGKYTDPKNNRYNVWMDEGLFRPRFQGQAAYISPPVAAYRSGPSGLVYDPGTAFDDRWRGQFLVTSFTGSAANGRIYAFGLKEQGAGFELAGETEILRGVLSPGLRIGPDGALYLTDWINGWAPTGSGRIWKLDSPAAAANPMRAEVRGLLRTSFNRRSAADLFMLLGHADMRVRQKAQFELVRRRDVESLLAAARVAGRPLASIHAIWGLGQLMRTRPADVGGRLTPFLRHESAEVRAQTARVLGDVRDASAASSLLPLLSDASLRARFFAAEALGRIGHKPAAQALVQMLAENDDRDANLRHAGSLALASVGDPASLSALATHPSRGVRLAAVIALRRQRDAGVARFLDDADETVMAEAARAINDDEGIALALPALARVLERPRVTNEPLLRRAVSANARVGSAEALNRLTAFAAGSDGPQLVRADAVAAVGVWMAPSNFDRVDGSYLGPVSARDAGPARSAMMSLVPLLDRAESTAPLKLAIIDAAARLELAAAAPALVTRLQHDTNAPVRVAAMRALTAVKAGDVGAAVNTAMADTDTTVRMAAIRAMASLPLDDATKASHLAKVVRERAVPEQQSALEALGRIPGRATEALLMSLLGELDEGKIAPEIQLDVLDAARAIGAEPVLARLETLGAGRSLDRMATTFPAALQRGGAAGRGREVAMQHAAAQCTRCHAMADATTATAGPALNGVGTRLTRDQLLQSLLEPSARISPGFGVVSIALKNGQRVDGILREEADTHLVVEGSTGSRQQIAMSDIKARVNAPSAMPAMGAILKPREIRDLIEFLASMKK